MTQGVLDPTALPLIRLWNWKDPNPSIPSAGEIEAAKQLVGWTKVRRSRGRIFLPTPGMALDFGGFGKEYAGGYRGANSPSITASPTRWWTLAMTCGCWELLQADRPGTLAWSDPRTSLDYHQRSICDYRQPGHRIIRGLYSQLQNRLAVVATTSHYRSAHAGWPVANGCQQATIIADHLPSQAGVLSTTCVCPRRCSGRA